MTDDVTPRPLRYHLNKAREETSEQLMQGFVDGYVTEEELDERLEMVTRAETLGELQALVGDLPERSTELTAPARTELARRQRGELQRDSVRAIFGGNERRMRGEAPDIIEVQAICGGIELDLSETSFPRGKLTVLRVSVICGGVDVTIPAGIRVENQSTPILGGVTTPSTDSQGADDESPGIRLEGTILLGGVSIRVSGEDFYTPRGYLE